VLPNGWIVQPANSKGAEVEAVRKILGQIVADFVNKGPEKSQPLEILCSYSYSLYF
jgi:hypothetical protein